MNNFFCHAVDSNTSKYFKASLTQSLENVSKYSYFYFWFAGLCPDWDSWDQTKPVDNAREAMQQADDWLGVPQVL